MQHLNSQIVILKGRALVINGITLNSIAVNPNIGLHAYALCTYFFACDVFCFLVPLQVRKYNTRYSPRIKRTLSFLNCCLSQILDNPVMHHNDKTKKYHLTPLFTAGDRVHSRYSLVRVLKFSNKITERKRLFHRSQ